MTSVTSAPAPAANDAGTIMNELLGLARGLDKAANRLAEATREFEGGPDADGVWQPGPQLLFESAIATKAAAIYTEAISAGEKAPPEPVRDAMALAHVLATEPNLHADYHRLRSELASLQKWISARKDSISARQSVLSAERSMAR